VIDPVARSFAGTAAVVEEPLRSDFARLAEAVQREGFLDELQAANPAWAALLRNTCSLTELAGSSKINVIPPEASLGLDCRLLPD